jgi:hypothetical protein
VQWAGAIADWLHNLAMFSARDFRGFDEQLFWKEFETICAHYLEDLAFWLGPAMRRKSGPPSGGRRLRRQVWGGR